jgi:hypothetical protein
MTSSGEMLVFGGCAGQVRLNDLHSVRVTAPPLQELCALAVVDVIRANDVKHLVPPHLHDAIGVK